MFPNAFAQLRAREDTPWLSHQDFQQHQLPRRELDALRGAVNIVGCEVESEIADAQGQNGFLGITPPQRADAGHQFLHGKWLGQIIVSSKLQPSYSIIDSAACG